MAKTLVGALALALLPSALAFQNTSPFFLFSTSDLLVGDNAAFAQSQDVADQVLGALKDCPSDTYFIIHQPGVSSADYADRLSSPRLASYMAGGDGGIRTTKAVSEVYQQDGWADAMSDGLRDHCGAVSFKYGLTDDHMGGLESALLQAGDAPKVVQILLQAPRGSDRARTFTQNDQILEILLHSLVPSSKYTVLYTTSPQADVEQTPPPQREPPAYEMESPLHDAVRMELKRDTTFTRRANSTQQGGLFERYQYFTPGLFMAFTAMVPLVIILGVGLNALANLEVSYFAFSKEMGPTNQKKQ